MTDNPIPEKYRTDHLILLVGSNPLPNWVAGRLLCKPEGTIHLVHSAATQKIAKEQLQKRLDKKRCKLYSLGNKQADSKMIYDTVQAILEKVIPKDATVGLNYTGGTKTMSVHAYEAAFWFDNERVVCSYLDAWTLNMVIIGKMGQSDYPYYVGNCSEVKIKEVKHLMDLHGIQLQTGSPVTDLSPLFETCSTMAQIYNRKDSREAWFNYCQREKRLDRHKDEQKKRKKDNDESYRRRINRIALPEREGLNRVRKVIQRSKPDLTTFDLQSIAKAYGLDVVEVAEWFHGFWLEDYVLNILKNLEKPCGLNQPAKNFKAKNPKNSKDPEDLEKPKFEFDVAVTRGYQLFAFSCTTSSDKKRCKLKLFEAYTRAKQMGGDEARIALVCNHENPQFLEDDLSYEFDATGRIKVFGLPELVRLEDRIKEWFKTTYNQQKRK